MNTNNLFELDNNNTNELKKDDLPLIEKYRPQTLSELNSDKEDILKEFIKNKSLPNLLFYGPPGTGKTSTISACAKDIYGKSYNYMILEFNASDERGVDIVRDKIKTFVNTKTFFTNGTKLVILDEIDSMTFDAQKILRQVIEKYSSNARFCLICNYISKIIPSLQSRCIKFRFNPLPDSFIYSNILNITKNEKIKSSSEGRNEIVKISDGDMRKAYNILQSTYMTFKKINEKSVNLTLNNYRRDDINKVIKWLSNKSLEECYKKIEKLQYSKGLTLKNLINELTNFLINYDMDIEKKKELFIKLSEIEFNQINITNNKIQLCSIISAFKLVDFNIKNK